MPDYNYTGNIQYVTIGISGTYDITAEGAQGGASFSAGGGAGASVGGDVSLASGTELEIVVGGEGGSGFNDGSGGGGSFVIEMPNGSSAFDTILAVAGGGGGGASNYPGDPGRTGATGGSGGGMGAGAGGINGAAGHGGQDGGGGGGFTGGNGAASFETYGQSGAVAGHSFVGGAAGSSTGGGGGFGGGGGSGGFSTFEIGGAGGGGGYGGGGGGGPDNEAGGGGGSYLNTAFVTNGVEAANVNDGNGSVTIEEQPLCYLVGTRILTPTGEVCVEALKRGDRVVTRFGGLQRIKWIGRQSYRAAALRDKREHIPVRFKPGSLGEGLPARDLDVSPGHSMLIEGTLVLAKSLVNGITITQSECPERIDYFQIELEGHDCVIAEGTWSETYADWENGRKCFHNAAEFYALYPEHHAPEEPLLCAPRPERGAGLDAALRAVVARASSEVEAGPLKGYIDCVRGEWKLDGWAHDSQHPEMPVLLEVLLESKVIGTVLACDFRTLEV